MKILFEIIIGISTFTSVLVLYSTILFYYTASRIKVVTAFHFRVVAD